jgi:hypothetical protein
MVLRRTFGPLMEEETGGWRKLYIEELHNLYFTAKYYLDDLKKESIMCRACSIHGGYEKCLQCFDWKT